MKPFSDEKILSDIKGHYQLQAHGFQHALDAGIEAITKVQKYEKAIKDIKTEIMSYRDSVDRAISEDEFKRDGMKTAYQDCIEIIDKHMRG